MNIGYMLQTEENNKPYILKGIQNILNVKLNLIFVIVSDVYVDCKGMNKYETHPCSCRKPEDPHEKSCMPDTCLNR